MKSIVHLSDLHLSDSKKYGFHWKKAKELVTVLVNDIHSLSKENNLQIDAIFFTGDLTFSGTKEQFQLFDEHFLSPLIQKLNISKKNIFITPGNHDVDRSKVHPLEKQLRTGSDENFISSYFDMINNGEYSWERLYEYCEYNKTILDHHSDVEQSGRMITCFKVTNKLYVVSVNSAWLAMDDNDIGNLRITQKQIDFINRAKIPSDAKIILLCHHPLDWLNKNDRDIFSTFIEKKVSIFFFGHMHDFKQKLESSFCENITLFLQAGTLDTSENVSGYSLINFNSSNVISDGRIFYRKYNKEKTCYEPWEERGNGGVFDFTTEKTLTFDSEKFATLSNEILEKTDKDLLINIGISDEKKKSLRALFTEPNFLEFALGAMPSMEIKSTQELLEGRNNLVIVGNHSSGKTSLLKYLFIKSLEKQACKDFSNFAFFLDLNAIELNSLNTIVSALCTQYFNADSTTSFEEKIKKMLHEGRCVIYIDNLDNINTKEQCVISDFFIKFKECRFIVTAGYNNSDLLVKILSDESKAKFHAIAIGSLRRSNVRDIVSRWHDTTSQNIIYKEITRTINNSQLPHNYFTYSMLLAIYEVDHDVKGILSESDIIENFIEILLRKHFMDTPPNKPQFKELRHFLGYLGFTLFKNKCNFISNNDLLQTAIIFNRDTMHDYQVEDYIKPLKECGILKEELCNVIFSQPCFLYYSIAYFMKHNEELKKEILSDNNYLHLHKVIEYYSSQNSSSLDLLYLLKKKTNAIKSSLSERMLEDKGINIEDIKIEDSNTFSILDMVSTQDDFEKKIESLRADREKDDARLDELSPLSDKDKKANISNVRAEGNNNLLHDLINTLSLYARVFRSTELSMERENILNIFNDLVKGYVFYMKASLVLMDDSFVLPVILPALEKKMQEDKLTDNERQRVFEMFKLVLSLVRSMIPNNIQFIMSNDLSSKKPRIANIITESKDSNSNPVEKAILTFTLMDIKDEMVIQLANDLAKIQNKVVQESLFFKINQIITSNYDLKRTEEEALKELAKNIGIKRKLILTPKISDAFNTLNRIGH